MNPLDLVKLTALMEITSGKPEVVIGLIDGPIASDLPDLASKNIRALPESTQATCTQSHDIACIHGTFAAGILCAKRDSVAPAICPDCTLIVRPIFLESKSENEQMPSADPEELAAAIIDVVKAGAQVLNLSVALVRPSPKSQNELDWALDYAAGRGVIVVAAAGNQGTIGSTSITRHQCVIPVAACDLQGRPINYSNFGSSIGRRGLSAPGDNITSLGPDSKPLISGGTSAATPFVTGAIALLWSEFPSLTVTNVRFAITQPHSSRQKTVVPPLLDAWSSYQVLVQSNGR